MFHTAPNYTWTSAQARGNTQCGKQRTKPNQSSGSEGYISIMESEGKSFGKKKTEIFKLLFSAKAKTI